MVTQNSELDALYLSILEFISSSKSGFKKEENIFEAFVGVCFNKSAIKSLLRALEQLQYIEKSDEDPQRIQLLDSDFNDVSPEQKIKGYKITGIGKTYLRKQGYVKQTIYSNINNSNIANESPYAKQSIKISEQDEETQELLREYLAALESKDSTKIKKYTGYLLDKSVDLGVAVLAGGVIL